MSTLEEDDMQLRHDRHIKIGRSGGRGSAGPLGTVALYLALVLTPMVHIAAAAAESETFPSRSIKIIVPYSPGTGSDVLARTVGQAVAERSHQSVIVENRDGGGSLVGTLAAAKSPPDGYTMLIVANPFVIVPSQRSEATYDPIRDFVPVAKIAIIPLVLAASGSAPFASVREFIAYAKTNPGKLSYASSGPGTISQQEMELLKQAAGIDVVEIGYRSTAQAMNDLLAGHVALFPVVVSSVLQHLQSGRVRVLGVFDTRRSPQLPDVPPMSDEVRVAGYVPTPVWYGFVAPAGTPHGAVETLHDLIDASMQSQEVRDRLLALGAQPIAATNTQFTADLKAESEKSARIAKLLGTNR